MASPDYVFFVIFLGLRDETVFGCFRLGKAKTVACHSRFLRPLDYAICECLFL